MPFGLLAKGKNKSLLSSSFDESGSLESSLSRLEILMFKSNE